MDSIIMLDFAFLFNEFNYIYYIIIASIMALICYVLFYPYVIGGIYVLFFVSLLGGILGAKIFGHFIKMINNFFAYYDIEFFAVLLGVCIFNIIFYYISKKIMVR